MRTFGTVLAVILEAAVGAVLGFIVGFVLWIVLVEGGPEAPIGALLFILAVTVPIGVGAGVAVGWSLVHESASDHRRT